MKKLIFYIIIIITVGFIPSWIQYGGFCLTTDFLNQQIPFIIETKRMLSSGYPFWSWNTYFGDNFIADYSFYTLTSPFVWLNCLFPLKWIPESITLTLYLKLICIGLISYIYFRKMNLNKDISTIGSLLFTFSSFVTISIGFYHFLEPILCFPLLLWSIEKFLRREKYSDLLLGLSCFAVIFINFYFAPCSFIPAFIYLLCRLKTKDINVNFKYISYGLFIALLGILMSSFIVLPTINQIMGGNRTNVAELIDWHIEDRIGSLFIPKVREGEIPLLSFTGWNSTAAYIPILGCLLAFIYCLKKKDWIALLLIIVLIFYLTPLNGLFSLFTDIHYTRWAYALSFFLVLTSLKFIQDKNIISKKEIILYILITGIVVFFRYFTLLWKFVKQIPLSNSELTINIITLCLLVIGLFFLILYYKNRDETRLLKFIVTFSILQLGAFSYLRSDHYAINNSHDAIKIKLYDTYIRNNTFPYSSENKNYRTDIITRTQPYYYANVGLLKNIPSVSTYNSIRNKKINKLCAVVDSNYVLPNSGIIKDYNQTSFDCLMSVKDIIQLKDPFSTTKFDVEADLIKENEQYKLYKAKNYIPFGFTYDNYILQEDIDYFINNKMKIDLPLLMLASLAIQEKDVSDLNKYLKPSQINDYNSLDSIVQKRKQFTAQNVKWTTEGFKCNTTLPEDKIMFFSLPSDPGFTASIDGRFTNIYEVNCGLSAILVPKGLHTIIFSFTPKGLKEGFIISIISLILLLIITRIKCYYD